MLEDKAAVLAGMVQGAEVLPVSIEEAPPPIPPSELVTVERVRDKRGRNMGLNVRAREGHVISVVRLSGLTRYKTWKSVQISTRPVKRKGE